MACRRPNPPPHLPAQDSANDADSTDSSPLLTPKTDASTPTKRPTLNGFCKFGADPKWMGDLVFEMAPKPRPGNTDEQYSRGDWVAVLQVQCDDISRLMREGFFWSSENVRRGEDRIICSMDKVWYPKGLRYTRRSVLVDKPPSGISPRWVAQLDVLCRFYEGILPNFRPEKLSRNKVFRVQAWEGPDELVYQYDLSKPDGNVNRIYGDAPLEGWWPWPRNDGILPWPRQVKGWWPWPWPARSKEAAGGVVPEGKGSSTGDEVALPQYGYVKLRVERTDTQILTQVRLELDWVVALLLILGMVTVNTIVLVWLT